MLIRAADPARDGAACAAIYAPYVRDTAITFDLEPPSATDMAGRIAQFGASHAWLVAEVDGVVVGYAHAGPHMARAAYDRTANLGVYLAMDARGRGLGRALYTALIAELTARGFHALMACITLPNDPSERLHAGLGFVRVGTYREVGWKFGAWHDVGWWQLVV